MSGYYHDQTAPGKELLLDGSDTFSLGQLILATRLPTRIVSKLNANGTVGQIMQYEGTWFAQMSSNEGIVNHAHFSLYVKKGPGVWWLNQETDVAVPMTKEELLSMYRFHLLNN